VLVVMAAGWARLRRDTPVVATSDDVALGDVALAASRRVEGAVLAADGTPQPRIAVTLGAPSTERDDNFYGRSVGGFTDDLGRFRFADVAPGAYSITARTPGRPDAAIDIVVPAAADVLDVKLVRAATRELTVTVVDSSGSPVADVVVEASTRSGAQVHGRTDGRGVARVSVPLGETVQMDVLLSINPSRKFLRAAPRDLGKDESDVRVVLEEGAELTGRLVDPDGAPVAQARIRFATAGDAKLGATTDDDGTFHVMIPRSGRVSLAFDGAVQSNGRMQDSSLTAHLEDVAPGANLVVRCERTQRDRKLTVVVVTAEDAAIEGASVNVSSAMGLRLSATTDGSGIATFENLPAVELDVNAWFQGRDVLPPVGARAVPAGQELRLVCRVASRITGLVVGEDGTVSGSGYVQAFRDARVVGLAQVDSGGKFTLLLPVEDTAAVRLELTRTPGNKSPDAVLDAVAPGTQNVRLVVKK
jgi:carboxypeptidase family protein